MKSLIELLDEARSDVKNTFPQLEDRENDHYAQIFRSMQVLAAQNATEKVRGELEGRIKELETKEKALRGELAACGVLMQRLYSRLNGAMP